MAKQKKELELWAWRPKGDDSILIVEGCPEDVESDEVWRTQVSTNPLVADLDVLRMKELGLDLGPGQAVQVRLKQVGDVYDIYPDEDESGS